MALSPYFQEAIDLVDDTQTVTSEIDPTYGEMEWSFAALHVKGGSDMACEVGAARLMRALGFRFYLTRHEPGVFEGWKTPATIHLLASAEKQENWVPSADVFLVYGHSWNGSTANNTLRETLNDHQNRWATLNGVNVNTYPTSSRWLSITDDATGDSFRAAHPETMRVLHITAGTPHHTFAIDQMTIGDATWDLTVQYAAARVLAGGFNEFNRTNFDAPDGDDNPSERFWPFVKAVNDAVRAGTAELTWSGGSIAAQAAVPDATLGAYVYAGHKMPPADSYAPAGFGMATAFNNTGLTYEELFAQHAAKAGFAALREYTDTEVWSRGKPMANARAKPGYFKKYDGYHAAGMVSVITEHTAHWFVNAAFSQFFIEKVWTGTLNESAIIDQMVDDIFDGDAAVLQLYNYWNLSPSSYNVLTLRRSFDIVDDMAEGWYKPHFKNLLTFLYVYHKLENYTKYGYVVSPSDLPNDTYLPERLKWASWARGLAEEEVNHGYATIRQEMNAALTTAPFNYPTYKFNYTTPVPEWFITPTLPTEQDWLDSYAAISAETVRPLYLDDISDLVVRRVTPPGTMYGDKTTLSNSFRAKKAMRVVVHGPARLNFHTWVNQNTLGPLAFSEEYAQGLHSVDVEAGYFVINEGGRVYMPFEYGYDYGIHPPGYRQRHWLWRPTHTVGLPAIEAASRWSLWNADTTVNTDRIDVVPGTTTEDLIAGVYAIDNVQSGSAADNKGFNVFISQDPHQQLMPRALAEAEFNCRGTLTVAVA